MERGHSTTAYRAAVQSKPLSPLFFSFVSKIAALCHILRDICVTAAWFLSDQMKHLDFFDPVVGI